jgi:hypothetical protein
MGIAMMGVMHLYFAFTQPLFVQTIMTLKGLYDAKPIWIHVLGKSAEGDLKRPFQSPGMFGGMSNFFCTPLRIILPRLFALPGSSYRPFTVCLSTLHLFSFSPLSSDLTLPFV